MLKLGLSIQKYALHTLGVPVKARTHCEIFLLDYFMKCVLRDVSLCKLARNVHDILFKSIFRIFSIMKDFTIEFVSMLD